jgi:F420-0:gamma-glutamyl ligase-like protein
MLVTGTHVAVAATVLVRVAVEAGTVVPVAVADGGATVRVAEGAMVEVAVAGPDVAEGVGVPWAAGRLQAFT